MSLLTEPESRFRVSPFGLEFTIYGSAQPGGSKRAFKAKNSDRIIVTDDNPKARDWKNDVKIVAAELMKGRALFDTPLQLEVTFYMVRPKGHYGAHGVKRSAPKVPTVRPDVTKLLRPLEDALTGIIWRDDSQIVDQIARKRYGDPARVEVKVSIVL